jgi:hypothetical protein
MAQTPFRESDSYLPAQLIPNSYGKYHEYYRGNRPYSDPAESNPDTHVLILNHVLVES